MAYEYPLFFFFLTYKDWVGWSAQTKKLPAEQEINPPPAQNTDSLRVERAIDTPGELICQGQRYPIRIGLNTYAEMDFVSIALARQLSLRPYRHTKH